ncbi:hypothetical protein Ciccas_005009 [Cichlidogyrus casuarinus]|uniref:Potassium channel domain-containing protein n=1 Tax=Cichlidogyrus casuarinus TaxID=1844966 RepID=A0ABD2QAA9_9PLAT
MRAINIFEYGEVFTYMGFLTSNRRLQFAQLFFAMFAMWMVGAGIMHLIDRLGDFWNDDAKVHHTSYFSNCYFLLVTMSTVGYGDMTPQSELAKGFICIFVPVSMGFFASFVPELVRNIDGKNMANLGRYRTIFGQKQVHFAHRFSQNMINDRHASANFSFDRNTYFLRLTNCRHVLVCGHFTNESIRSFLKGFFHVEHANRRKNLNMVILRPQVIDLALKAILTKYHAWTHYFNGTPNNPQDLSRISLRDARAAIVLAAPNSKFSEEEDGANIMQAITLKAQRERLRVLVQLHHSRNKSMLHNFPRWTCLSNDMVICMDELKLGLMAYNCMAPGFSTLVLNLLNSHRSKVQTDKVCLKKTFVRHFKNACKFF